MNKKFLSAILFGALMVTSTGTFVSCKDYDDEIDEINGKIDKLATKEDMTAQIATLNAAISAAKTEAVAAATEAKATADAAKAAAATAGTDAAKAKADAAQAVADAAQAKVDAIAAAEAKVAALKKELEETIGSEFESMKKELATSIATLTEEIETLTGFTTSMLTAVQLQGIVAPLDLSYAKFGAKLSVYPTDKTSGKEGTVTNPTSYEFGKDMTGSFTVNAHETFPLLAHFMFSASPVNAAVSNEMLSIVNTKGESINDFVDISVAPYDGLLDLGDMLGTMVGSRSVTNGLQYVTVNMKKDADKAAFAEALVNQDKKDETNILSRILFALAVTKDGRTVTSPYHIAAFSEEAEYTEATKIAEYSTIKSDIEKEATLDEYKNDNSSATVNAEDCYPVENGKAFKIVLASENEDDKSVSPIMASYITVDMDNKALSTTDKAAIKGITFTGINTVSKSNVFSLTASGANAKGVVIPLRIHTIDFTGTYHENVVVWVKAGEPVAAQTLAYTVTPEAFVAEANITAYEYEGFSAASIPADAVSYKLSIDVETGVPTERVKVNETTDKLFGGTTLKFFQSDKKTEITGDVTPAKIAKTAYAKITTQDDATNNNEHLNLRQMREDKAYKGTLTFYDKDGTVVRVDEVEITKVLPTAAPKDFVAKSQQIINGVFSCYLNPSDVNGDATWNNPAYGSMNMKDVFYGLDSHYTFTFADSKIKDAATEELEDIVIKDMAADNYVLTVAKEFISDKEHDTKVVYNYGDITFNHADFDYVVDAASFKTVYCCFYAVSSWEWAKDPKDGSKHALTYNTESTVKASDIKGTNTWTSNLTKTLDLCIGTDVWTGLTLKAEEGAKLVSNDSQKVDYFDVEFNATTKVFTFKPTKKVVSVPAANVPSTLQLIFIDMYGHERPMSFPMLVKK